MTNWTDPLPAGFSDVDLEMADSAHWSFCKQCGDEFRVQDERRDLCRPCRAFAHCAECGANLVRNEPHDSDCLLS